MARDDSVVRKLLSGSSAKHYEESGGDELESLCEDIIAAVRSRDAEQLCDCLRAFVELCEEDEGVVIGITS